MEENDSLHLSKTVFQLRELKERHHTLLSPPESSFSSVDLSGGANDFPFSSPFYLQPPNTCFTYNSALASVTYSVVSLLPFPRPLIKFIGALEAQKLIVPTLDSRASSIKVDKRRQSK